MVQIYGDAVFTRLGQEQGLKSRLWKICSSLNNLFNTSTTYEAKNGVKIKFWENRWLETPLRYTYPCLYTYKDDHYNWINEIWDNTQIKGLKQPLSNQSIIEYNTLLNQLYNTQIHGQEQDIITWNWNSKGKFSVKSAYEFLVKGVNIIRFEANIWKIKTIPKIKHFIWLCSLNRLLTLDNLIRRGWQLPNRCILCKRGEESLHHIMGRCTYTVAVWTAIDKIFDINILDQSSIIEAILNPNVNKEKKTVMVQACFELWKERCNRIFQEKSLTHKQLVRKIKEELAEYRHMVKKKED